MVFLNCKFCQEVEWINFDDIAKELSLKFKPKCPIKVDYLKFKSPELEQIMLLKRKLIFLQTKLILKYTIIKFRKYQKLILRLKIYEILENFYIFLNQEHKNFIKELLKKNNFRQAFATHNDKIYSEGYKKSNECKDLLDLLLDEIEDFEPECKKFLTDYIKKDNKFIKRAKFAPDIIGKIREERDLFENKYDEDIEFITKTSKRKLNIAYDIFFHDHKKITDNYRKNIRDIYREYKFSLNFKLSTTQFEKMSRDLAIENYFSGFKKEYEEMIETEKILIERNIEECKIIFQNVINTINNANKHFIEEYENLCKKFN